MSTPAAVIQAGPPSRGGGLSSLPGGWRTVAIGGGIVLALIVVLLQRGKGGGESAPAGDGDLSTSENVALGQVAYEQRQAANDSATRDANLAGQLAGLFDRIGETEGNLTGQISGLNEYQRQMMQSIQGLYFPIITGGDTSPEMIEHWWNWSRGKFQAYGLGELPPYIPGQGAWGASPEQLAALTGTSAPPAFRHGDQLADGVLGLDEDANEPSLIS